jgi:magnesium-transporting ATPase (P-type)
MNIIDWVTSLKIIEGVIIVIVFIIVVLLFATFFLYLALKIVDAKNTDFGDVFVSALLMALVGWIPCIGCILQWLIISNRHKTSILKAIIIWLIAGLLPIIITIIIIAAIVLPLLGIVALPTLI